MELVFGIEINPFNEFILFLGFIGLLMLLVLALKRGNPEENQWGNPNKQRNTDSGAIAPPPVR